MKKILLSSVLCASMMFAASDYKYEITPMIGGTFAEGNLNIDDDSYANGGLSLGFNLDDSMFNQVELGFLRSLEDVEYENTTRDTGVTRVFANLVKDYGISDSMSLYALAGAGVEWFDDEAFNENNGLFANYGAGIKYKLTEAIALKADVRHLVSLGRDLDPQDNNLLYTIGLAIPFGKKAAPAPVVPTPEPTPLDSDNDGVIDANDKCPNSPVGAVVDATGCEIDSDGDGVVDSKDKCPTTPKGDVVNQDGCTLIFDLKINFDFDSDKITNTAETKIKEFADLMKSYPNSKGRISAHTDSKGSAKYNQKLSEKRAAAAVQALETFGISKDRLTATGYGETMPAASNDTEEGRAANRRVEGSIQK